jgi:acyl carrier protein
LLWEYNEGRRAIPLSTALPVDSQPRKRTKMTSEQTSKMDTATIRQMIHDQIQFNFLFDGDEEDFSDDDSLVGRHIVDKTGILEIVLFVQETYGIEVSDAELTPDNFDTVNNIAAYVTRRLANM